MKVWPSGWVCHAVRAPGSKVTLTASTRAGAGAWFSGSMRTLPVKYSVGPLPDGCEPLRFSSIFHPPNSDASSALSHVCSMSTENLFQRASHEQPSTACVFALWALISRHACSRMEDRPPLVAVWRAHARDGRAERH